jgi:hypothetical protein
MNINPVSSLLPSWLQPANNAGSTSTIPVTLNAAQDGAPISPLASALSPLQQLEQTDPAQFQQVTTNIVDQLRKAAQNATNTGNTTQAAQLNQLADQFQTAAADGQIPSPQQLQQAGVGHHHHHHGHGHHGGGQTSQTNSLTTNTPDTQDVLQSILNSSLS